MSVETVVYGLIFGVLIVLTLRWFSVRLTPWREATAAIALTIALWAALRAAGVDSFWSTTVGFIGATLLVSAWKRFARRAV